MEEGIIGNLAELPRCLCWTEMMSTSYSSFRSGRRFCFDMRFTSTSKTESGSSISSTRTADCWELSPLRLRSVAELWGVPACADWAASAAWPGKGNCRDPEALDSGCWLESLLYLPLLCGSRLNLTPFLPPSSPFDWFLILPFSSVGSATLSPSLRCSFLLCFGWKPSMEDAAYSADSFISSISCEPWWLLPAASVLRSYTKLSFERSSSFAADGLEQEDHAMHANTYKTREKHLWYSTVCKPFLCEAIRSINASVMQ